MSLLITPNSITADLITDSTTIGRNLVKLPDPGATTFPRFDAANTVTALSATDFRTAIGAGTSSTTGTVTSVGGTGTVSGLSLSGTVTTTGNLTLGGTLAVTPSDFASQTANTFLAAPNGASGVPTFRTIVTSDLGSGTANSTTYLRGDSTWATVVSGASVSNDTTTNASYYPLWATATTGTPTTIYTSSTKLYFNPSTGTLNATVFNSLSDINFKTNVTKLTYSIDAIKQLNGYSFDWKDGSGSSYGVVAQEVEKILPNAVTQDNDQKSVNYAAIVPFLIEAVKEQQSTIETLESRIAKLEDVLKTICIK